MNEASALNSPVGLYCACACVRACVWGYVGVFARQHATAQTHARGIPAACVHRRREVQQTDRFVGMMDDTNCRERRGAKSI